MLARNMDVKGDSGEVSNGNEEQVIGYWRKGDCYGLNVYVLPQIYILRP